MQLVGDELVILRRDCVEGIVASEDRCPAEAESSIALSRVLATIFGYPEGVKVAHYCEEHGVTASSPWAFSTRPTPTDLSIPSS